ncbi:MAG TPA: hypothetical protein VIU15_43445 [Streptomyces sp.]
MAVRSFAEEQGRKVGCWYTDDHLGSACEVRPERDLVRQAMKSGHADGFVVPTCSPVSLSSGECAEQLDGMERHLAFIAVVEEGGR